jgi:hypothetical protein
VSARSVASRLSAGTASSYFMWMDLIRMVLPIPMMRPSTVAM